MWLNSVFVAEIRFVNKNETVMVKSYCTLIQWQFIYFFIFLFLWIRYQAVEICVESRTVCILPCQKKKKGKKKSSTFVWSVEKRLLLGKPNISETSNIKFILSNSKSKIHSFEFNPLIVLQLQLQPYKLPTPAPSEIILWVGLLLEDQDYSDLSTQPQ